MNDHNASTFDKVCAQRGGGVEREKVDKPRATRKYRYCTRVV